MSMLFTYDQSEIIRALLPLSPSKKKKKIMHNDREKLEFPSLKG